MEYQRRRAPSRGRELAVLTRSLITRRASRDLVDAGTAERDYVLAHVVAQLHLATPEDGGQRSAGDVLHAGSRCTMGDVQRSGQLAATALLVVGLGTAGGAVSTAAHQASAKIVPAVSSVALAQPADSVAVADDHVLLVGEGCSSVEVNPATLEVRPVHGSCSGTTSVRTETVPGAPDVRLRVIRGFDVSLQAERVDPRTHRPVVGPVLMRLPDWSWIHSAGPVVGGGSIWIYGAGATPGPLLLELSARSGALEHRFVVNAGIDPLLVAGSNGAWITPGVFGGRQCDSTCRLYHVAPGVARVSIAMYSPGLGDEWLTQSGDTVVVDVVSRTSLGYVQSLKGLDVASGRPVFDTAARVVPGPTFAGYGYLVVSSSFGLVTLSELQPRARTPTTVSCANGAPVEVIRIDPATGAQSELAVLPERAVRRDCATVPLIAGQAVVYEDALYFLSDPTSVGHAPLSRLVRVRL